ncbi:MAG: TadE/TadG family type IV pilus assembly protein [Thermacetogeniaceae bacterium]
MKKNRGSAVIEMVLIMPLILILFIITIWGGQLMFTWTSINYSATNAAMDAAKTGKVTDDICTAALGNIKQWVPGAKNLDEYISHDSNGPPCKPDKIVFWTPNDDDDPVPWKSEIKVAIVYPYKVDSPLLSLLGETFFGGDVIIYLKGEAMAQSEVLPEND